MDRRAFLKTLGITVSLPDCSSRRSSGTRPGRKASRRIQTRPRLKSPGLSSSIKESSSLPFFRWDASLRILPGGYRRTESSFSHSASVPAYQVRFRRSYDGELQRYRENRNVSSHRGRRAFGTLFSSVLMCGDEPSPRPLAYPQQRCGIAVPNVHPVCHLDDARRRDNGQYVDVTGGWHDAGDLRKWMETALHSGIALLQLARNLGSHWNLDGSGLPPLLDEIKWGNRYWLKMQDTDGKIWK